MAASSYDISAKRIQRKWTKEENEAILDYLEETRFGHKIEKPNARIYYDQLISEKRLRKCNWLLLKNKVRNMQTNYKKALDWQRKTGQEILDKEGEKSFTEALNAKFPHADRYETIWGGKTSIHLPHVAMASQVGSAEEGTGQIIEVYTLEEEMDSFAMSPPTTDTENSSVELPEPDMTSDVSAEKSAFNQPLKRPHDSGRAAYLRATLAREKASELALAIQKEHLGIEKEELGLKREELELKRDMFRTEADLKRQKLDKQLEFKREKYRTKNETLMKLKSREFEFESQRMELEHKKLDIQKLEIETNRDIRMMELSIEKLKWAGQVKDS